jgi:adenylyltransferase/sulfurtransferase
MLLDVPLKELVKHPSKYVSERPTVVTCRLGNDSQIAADALRTVSTSSGAVQDLIGGLRAWSTQVDNNFPQY